MYRSYRSLGIESLEARLPLAANRLISMQSQSSLDVGRIAMVGDDLFFSVDNGSALEVWMSSADKLKLVYHESIDFPVQAVLAGEDRTPTIFQEVGNGVAFSAFRQDRFWREAEENVWWTSGEETKLISQFAHLPNDEVWTPMQEVASAHGWLLATGRNMQLNLVNSQEQMALPFPCTYPQFADFHFADDTIYFSAQCGFPDIPRFEFYKTDGETFDQIGEHPFSGQTDAIDGNVIGIVDNGTLFAALDEVHGQELWIKDRTSGEHMLVNDIAVGSADSRPVMAGDWPNLIPRTSERMLLFATDAEHGRELWSTDGTADGTQLLADMTAGGGSSRLTAMHELADGRTLLGIQDGLGNDIPEVWITDGTPVGTSRVFVLPNASEVTEFTSSPTNHNSFAFETSDGRLWQSGYSQETTRPIALDAILERSAVAPSSNVTEFGDKLLITTEENRNQNNHTSVWIWDESTGELTNPLNLGRTTVRSSFAIGGHTAAVLVQDLTIFGDGKLTAWILNDNGAAREVNLDAIIQATPIQLKVVSLDSEAFVLVGGLSNAGELWRFDANAQASKVEGNFIDVTEHGETLYALRHGEEPLVVIKNGTETSLSVSLDDHGRPGRFRLLALTAGPDSLYIYSDSGVTKLELSSQQQSFQRASQFKFLATNANGRAFWVTIESNQERPWSAGEGGLIGLNEGLSSIEEMTAIGSQIYFIARVNQNQQFELRSWDGVAEQSLLIKTFEYLAELTYFDDALYFLADDGIHGTELWKTDGTSAKTKIAEDLQRGDFGSNSSELTVIGDRLYFSADDGLSRQVIWYIDARLTGDANGDGEVTLDDLLLLAENFGQATDQEDTAGDFDRNGFVDFQDFLVLAANFGHVR